ncbi:hypothetical protein Bbelb_445550 [Branchiostoma belcheri]|nr:hypothetical protein Bbelb_445550 [Branchiostoma belcheri]
MTLSIEDYCLNLTREDWTTSGDLETQEQDDNNNIHSDFCFLVFKMRTPRLDCNRGKIGRSERRRGHQPTTYLQYIQRLLGDNNSDLSSKRIADIAQNRTNWRELTVVCSNAAARR